MRNQSLLEVGISTLLAFTFDGCASPPSTLTKVEARAKLSTPTTEFSTICVFRSNQIISSAVLFSVQIDNQYKGRIAKGEYISGNLKPGKHRITASGGIPSTTTSLEFIAESGTFYYFKAGPGWNGLKLEQINNQEGPKQIISLMPGQENMFILEWRINDK